MLPRLRADCRRHLHRDQCKCGHPFRHQSGWGDHGITPLTGPDGGYLRSPDGTFITFNPPGSTATCFARHQPGGRDHWVPTLTQIRGSRFRARPGRHLHHVRSTGLHIHIPHRNQPGWRHHRRVSRCKRRWARVRADPVSQSVAYKTEDIFPTLRP